MSRKIFSVEELERILGHKAPDITPLVTWRREAGEEEAFNNLPQKDEGRPSSIRQTLELFGKKGNVVETCQRRSGVHVCFLEPTDVL